jgi:hypothetical protein
LVKVELVCVVVRVGGLGLAVVPLERCVGLVGWLRLVASWGRNLAN